MINYYEILGLTDGAGGIEIKNAFRRLAMLYHPDKNPEGKEQFNKILKAYEILSDPIKKSNYDYRLKYQTIASKEFEAKKNSGTKEWRFDEKELKRRQYYNEFIKKQTQEAGSFDNTAPQKRPYSDYKYIFFATPLAVILFVSIMKLANPYHSMRNSLPISTAPAQPLSSAEIKPNKNPNKLIDFFGTARYDSLQKKVLTIQNNSNSDAFVCMFANEEFLRSVFIKNQEKAQIGQLPGEMIKIIYCSGKDFINLTNTKHNGLDDSLFGKLHYYKKKAPLKLSSGSRLNLRIDHEGFVEVSKQEFFKK